MKSKLITRILLLLSTVILPGKALMAARFTVTSTANTGAGTLRQAITDANALAGLDTIQFAILPALNTFETLGVNSFAVITLSTTLPTITSPVFIDGFTQTDTNLGTMPGKTVGADAFVQAGIPYPDVYIVPVAGYSFPGSSTIAGNCININIDSVTIRGICISGWGNTSTASSTASGNAEIHVLRSATPRSVRININNCFLSCDPRGGIPALTQRKARANAILVAGNNFLGTISDNYIAHTGTYGIHFNGNIDISSVGPSGTIQNRNWIVESNQLIDISTSTTVTTGLAADGINLMKCVNFKIRNNWIEDVEQVGIDMGYNTDSNYVSNNTITGFVTFATVALPQVGIRVALHSQRDTLIKNLIYNNTGTTFRAGIWIDRSTIAASGVIVKGNDSNYIVQNVIHDNVSSGIVLANNGTGQALYNTISRNSTYNNGGLGIDLNFTGTAGTPQVNLNDANDADAGINNLQNFPIIDSATLTTTTLTVWGKVGAGSTVEFFFGDNGINKWGATTLNYAEGKTYLASAVEGSASDLATGVGSGTDVDGNSHVANLFRFSFVLSPAVIASVTSTDSLTSTSTLAGNTSEFGPQLMSISLLKVDMKNFSGTYNNKSVYLNWEGVWDGYVNEFEVERSTNGVDFQFIAKVTNTNWRMQNHYFKYKDENYANGINYYRLKIKNEHGKFMYSNTIRIMTESVPTLVTRLAPNPFINEVKVNMMLHKDDMIRMRLLDTRGNVLITKQIQGRAGANYTSLEGVNRLNNGNYILEVTADGQRHIETLLKQ
jgi:hypothetical protein